MRHTVIWETRCFAGRVWGSSDLTGRRLTLLTFHVGVALRSLTQRSTGGESQGQAPFIGEISDHRFAPPGPSVRRVNVLPACDRRRSELQLIGVQLTSLRLPLSRVSDRNSTGFLLSSSS